MRIDLILWFVCLFCLGSLNQLLAEQPYADFRFPGSPQNSHYPEDQFRWRPLNGETEYSGQGGLVNESPSFSSVMDYADTPPGLPRDVYRPVQEWHDMTPYKEGFRFRTLTPNDKLRIKRRDQENRQPTRRIKKEGDKKAPLNPYGYTDPNKREIPRFRPDEQLERKAQGGRGWEDRRSPYNPTFNGTYPAPIFRQD